MSLRRRIGLAAHRTLRRRAHRAVDGLDGGQLRTLIHQAAPIPGRIFTLVADAAAQRRQVHDRLEAMTHAELREAAGTRLPDWLRRLLAWLDR